MHFVIRSKTSTCSRSWQW